jgi:uncharacterized protein (DUF4415 family)
MSEKKRATRRSSKDRSDLKKVDSYVLGPKDYEDIPELSEEWFRSADLYEGKKLIRRGRPRSPAPKRPISLRLDPDVLAHFRRSGRGWQSRINAVLRKAAKLPKDRRKKA